MKRGKRKRALMEPCFNAFPWSFFFFFSDMTFNGHGFFFPPWFLFLPTLLLLVIRPTYALHIRDILRAIGYYDTKFLFFLFLFMPILVFIFIFIFYFSGLERLRLARLPRAFFCFGSCPWFCMLYRVCRYAICCIKCMSLDLLDVNA